VSENVYDLKKTKSKPKVKQGSVRDTLSKKSKAIWDKAQAKKKQRVSEGEKPKEKEKTTQRQRVEDLVRRVAQNAGAMKELGRLATPRK
jgi:acetyl-CoA carboxylase carboxyltransferase component